MMQKRQMSKEKLSSQTRFPNIRHRARLIVDNSFFVGFTMLLTIWALTGDDLRLLLTNKGADPIFNAMVVICIVVFTIELILSVVGKMDYFNSFFFWLDIISTMSLFLDITEVSDWLFNLQEQDDSGGASNMRGSRAAKIGAKAGRVVRVLRLIRILKIYKAYYDAQARKKYLAAAKERDKEKQPGQDDEWDDEELDEGFEEGEEQKAQQVDMGESRVGRKLSEMTTRRVICLILAMLLVLPLMRTEQAEQSAFSANFGADNVWQKFQDSLTDESSRGEYEHAILQYVYYHNWFARNGDPEEFCPTGNCADQYYSHLFWMGVTGKNASLVEAMASRAMIRDTDVGAWQDQFRQKNAIFNYGLMPPKARELLVSPWSIECEEKAGWVSRGVSLLGQEVPDVLSHTVDCEDELRPQESKTFIPRLTTGSQFEEYHFTFVFDLRPFVKSDSTFNLVNTLVILVLLVLASLSFSNDANRLLLNPVERMMQRVEAIRKNPLVAMKMADDEFKSEEQAKARLERARKDRLKRAMHEILNCETCAGKSQPMETVILEKTIIKLGSLLVLGFGEAGANIIGHNMKGGDSAGVNAMIPGTRVECVIGVCRVRDFSVATEVLQAKIMTFVNQIAEIVHGVINQCRGAPNKNSGDMFLVIWRVEDGKMADGPRRLAGLSILAFSRILGALHRSPLIAQYRSHPGLQYRLGSDCRVNLSFGLHAGWAIEGAVGSEFKIDASYLSPNVSIATSIERATEKYGVSIIVAQSVVELCTPELRSKCRLIDRVIITGSKSPMDLFCVDLSPSCVTLEELEPLSIMWNTRNRFKVRQFMETEKEAMASETLDLAAVFDADPVIRQMRRRYTTLFRELFNMGYQNYSQGEWQVARRMLLCTSVELGVEDGPSSALLRFMEVPYMFEAPRGWNGVRELSVGSVEVAARLSSAKEATPVELLEPP